MDSVAVNALNFEVGREENCFVCDFGSCQSENYFAEENRRRPEQCRRKLFVGEIDFFLAERVCDSKRDEVDVLRHENHQIVTEHVERKEAKRIADQLMADVPQTDAKRKKLIESGTKLVDKMGWDQVITDGLAQLLAKVAS